MSVFVSSNFRLFIVALLGAVWGEISGWAEGLACYWPCRRLQMTLEKDADEQLE